MSTETPKRGGTLRVGLVARGDHATQTPSPRAAELMTPVIEAFRAAGVVAEHVVYADEAADEVRAQLRSLDGALVWVNPIQDGATRATLDAVLRDVADDGVWVSAHPDTILTIGTKEVLFHTRHLGWGSDTDLYRTASELRERFPRRLATGRRVLKQGRGTGGQGVWRVELADQHGSVAGPRVRVEHALARGDGAAEELTLDDFLRRCEDYFAWSGCIVDQAYHPQLARGMIRCYVSVDEVVGFCHQYPRALLDDPANVPTLPSTEMVGPDVPAFAPLREAMRQWVPQMQQALGLDRRALPALWDADFFLRTRDPQGTDGYMLCEINVSAVWPFPRAAIEPMVRATVDGIRNNAPHRPAGSTER